MAHVEGHSDWGQLSEGSIHNGNNPGMRDRLQGPSILDKDVWIWDLPSRSSRSNKGEVGHKNATFRDLIKDRIYDRRGARYTLRVLVKLDRLVSQGLLDGQVLSQPLDRLF